MKELKFVIPFFGEKTIKLHNESKVCYNILEQNDEIERLQNNVKHLGIIHEVKAIPFFGRWTLIELMMTLIDEIMGSSKSEILGLGRSKVRLNNKCEFSSSRELLLSLSMLYSIGHLVGTFTSEHALLLSIVNKNKKDEFNNVLKKRIQSYKSADQFGQSFYSIINNENVFELFKIFTLLKVFNYFSTKESPKYQELIKLYIGRSEYMNVIRNSEQRNKLSRIIDFFRTIRNISFIILDGHFSQNPASINPYFIINNIDKIFENEYKELFDSLGSFYTNSIYQAPDTSYYHYTIMKSLYRMFNNVLIKSDISDLIDQLIKNELDNKISSNINRHTKSITYSNYNHLRLKTKHISKPLTLENRLFKNIKGGILYNISLQNYYLDYYKPESLSFLTIKEMLTIIYRIYDDQIVSKTSSKRISTNLRRLSVLNAIRNAIRKLYDTDLSVDVIKSLLGLLNSTMCYTIERDKLKFKSLIFDKLLREYIIELIEDASESSNSNHELKVAKKMISEVDLNKYRLCIYIPSIKVSSKQNSSHITDFDVFLLCYNNRNILIEVAEVKSGSQRIRDKQIKKYLECLGVKIDDEITKNIQNEFQKEINTIDRNCNLIVKKQNLVDSTRFKAIDLSIPL